MLDLRFQVKPELRWRVQLLGTHSAVQESLCPHVGPIQLLVAAQDSEGPFAQEWQPQPGHWWDWTAGWGWTPPGGREKNQCIYVAPWLSCSHPRPQSIKSYSKFRSRDDRNGKRGQALDLSPQQSWKSQVWDPSCWRMEDACHRVAFYCLQTYRSLSALPTTDLP